jgi:outer membrane protein assembly factor BamB
MAFTALAFALSGAVFGTGSAEEARDYWPQWRGPLGTGESPTAEPPIEWSEDENVRWKVALPGNGKASPIVWKDRVYVLTAIPAGEAPAGKEGEDESEGDDKPAASFMSKVAPDQPQRFTVLALERASGKVAWEGVAREAKPHEGVHGDASWASASAVTDGEVLIAHFGSNGLFAYDLTGKKLWERDLGKMKVRGEFGEGASPALHGDTLVVQWDHEGPCFVVALDKRTGEERWRAERDEHTSWGSPVIAEVDGAPQVLTTGTEKIRAYDLKSGELVWQAEGLTDNPVPTPVVVGDTAIFMSGFRGCALVAVRLSGAKGDIQGTEAIVWSAPEDTPYVPSPVATGGLLYFFKSNSGILTARDMHSGERAFGPERLESVENVYASPVAAAGRVYAIGRDGGVEVLAAGPKLEVLARNTLDEGFDASPALAGKELYLRGDQHLYCLAQD